MESRCNKCHVVQSITAFYKKSQDSEAIRQPCKICTRHQERQYYVRNIGVCRLKNKIYYEKNKKRCHALTDAWYKKILRNCALSSLIIEKMHDIKLFNIELNIDLEIQKNGMQ